ncbi:MAG: tetratricopeptide repeat protein [Gemmataceae bacterium]
MNRIRLLLAGFLLALPAVSHAQLTPDQQAEMLLNSARKAFNEKNYPFAAQRFQEFIQKYGGHKDANSARFSLALTMLEGPEKKFPEAQQILGPLAGEKNFADQGLASYYLGITFRSQGVKELLVADVNPNEAPQRRQNAQQRFEQGVPAFTQAVAILQSKLTDPPADKELSAEWEWVARARCDLAESLLRINKTKEAQFAALPFLKDPVLSRSKYKSLGRYHYGHASLLLGDLPTAQKTLTMIAPFTDAEFGPHARYLLARTHHLAEERGEASQHYEGAIADFAKNKKDAEELLKAPQKFNNDPTVRGNLESLVRSPAPEYLARANFYLGVLLYEAGRFAEAKTRFAEFPKNHADSPLKHEADLRIGFCQVQLKDYADALKTLTPLADKNPKTTDQVFFWIGKAHAGLANEAAGNPQKQQESWNNALGNYRQASDRANRLDTNQVPDAKQRRGEIALEIADTQQHFKQFGEAANFYRGLLNDKSLPDRLEEIHYRLCQAIHLAGDPNESDKLCDVFFKTYPQSTLTPAVKFVFGENQYFRAATIEKNPPSKERDAQLAKAYEDTQKRFDEVIEKYPEFAKLPLARYTVGLTHYRRGDLEKAQKTFEDIPAAERTGDLADVPFLIADCVLRLTPTQVGDDALAAGKLESQLKAAAEALETFIGGNPKHALTPDALVKFGLTKQRQAGLLAKVEEKNQALASARQAYEKVLSPEFPNHPMRPLATFERAKVLWAQNDHGNAMNEMRRFAGDLRTAKEAPTAIITLATILRSQNKAAEAATLLEQCRQANEGPIGQDASRAREIPLLRFHHGVALKESSKLQEARKLLETVVAAVPTDAIGVEAALRYGQCLRDEALLKLELARKQQQTAKSPPEQQSVQKLFDEAYAMVKQEVEYLEAQAKKAKDGTKLPELQARLLYEAAWGARLLSEPELKAAKETAAKEQAKGLGPAAQKMGLADIAIAKLPVTPYEKKATELYQTLIDDVGDAVVSVEARLELAELLAQRAQHDKAAGLLNDVIDKEPSQELTDKAKLHLGTIHAAKGNLKGAIASLSPIAANPKSTVHPWALYRLGEAQMAAKDFNEAAKAFVPFRDHGPYQNIPNLSDRALLRLGQAYLQAKNWEPSRQAFERLVNAFPQSVWTPDGWYGMGWALQQQNNLEGAVNAYTQTTARTVTETGAKAQYQIGACRAAQKRWAEAANAFLAVPTTYDYPELSGASLVEAARAYRELNQKDQVQRIVERIVRDYAGTPFVELAKELVAK